eukprot:TRINITY_DN15221_c0_g4_i1.p1 TRINITY_DN15221_c0_g4~~TRINITY_DN15221_c0_g4_i1.p1  ORF type:complete len:314 (+),score=62.85 TRINITY_DN15221_c0_g4_i1:955-1896(+)
MSTSSSGSSKCNYCLTNTVYNFVSESCVPCKDSEFAYPGDYFCSEKKPCTAEYDVVPVHSECEGGVRQVKYEFRKNTVCNTREFAIPPPKTGIRCKTCQAGSYMQGDKCLQCADGEYSTSPNSKTCAVCSEGYYAPKALLFAQLEDFPKEVVTTCEQAADAYSNPCEVYKGWIVVESAFGVPPYLPAGTVLSMRLAVEIKGTGSLEFEYEVEKEELMLVLDGSVNKMEPSSSKRKVFFILVEGNHTLEWIYKRTEEEDVKVRAAIHFINVTGTTSGSAQQCIKCPQGAISTGGKTECTKCPPGMTTNSDSTPP